MRAEPPTPAITPIRAAPPSFSASAADLAPLETGWSWTHRIVGAKSRIRTTIQASAGSDTPPEGLPSVFWAKRIELIAPGQPPRIGAVTAVAHESDGSVVAIGELVQGQSRPKLNRWDPARTLMPAVVKADSTWVSAGTRRRMVGLADVDLGRWKFPGCLVIELGPDGGEAKDRSYLAPGVGEVVTERRGDDGVWRVDKVIEE